MYIDSDENLSDIDEEESDRKDFLAMVEGPDCYQTDSEDILSGVISTSEDDSDFDDQLGVFEEKK